MWAWLVLLLLIIAEVVGIRWWLRKEFYPAFFNGWAVLIYCSILAADFIVAWLVSMLYVPGGTEGTAWLAVLGLALVVVVALMTFFFRWVVRHDMTDIPSNKQ
jgi:hypothetical protein